MQYYRLTTYKSGELDTDTVEISHSDLITNFESILNHNFVSILKVSRTPKVGDIVRVTDNRNGHKFEIGELICLVESLGDVFTFFYAKSSINNNCMWAISSSEFEFVN